MGKFKTFATGLATSLFLFSCSSESEQGGIVDNSPKNVSVSIELPRLAESKMVGSAGKAGDKVTLDGTVVIKAKQGESGAVVNTYTLDATDFFESDGTSKARTLEVNGTATYIEVEGNIDNATKTDDVNTRQGDAKSSVVRVTGGKNITAVAGANSTCAVELSPEMSRFEVVGRLGNTTNITNLVIDGIFLNNVKQKRADVNLVKSTKDTNPAWHLTYAPDGTKSKLFTSFTPAVSGMEDGKADGYNFFPQGGDVVPATKEEALKSHPHIILQVSYTDSEGNAIDGVFLNVVAFKNTTGTYFQNFENGKIYQLNLADVKDIIDVPVPPVTVDPDPDAVSVDITVSVKGWDIIVAKPEV